MVLNFEDCMTSISRSEERRVGKEGRSRWSPNHKQKKKKRNVNMKRTRVRYV